MVEILGKVLIQYPTISVDSGSHLLPKVAIASGHDVGDSPHVDFEICSRGSCTLNYLHYIGLKMPISA